MAGWRDLGSHTGFRIAPSGGFPCGFSIVGRLGPLHEADHAMGLRGRWAYRAVGLGTPLCSSPDMESSTPSINRRSMLSGSSQCTFSSSIVRDAMTLLVEGFARGRPPGRPLVEVSSRPITILQAYQKERKR